jgi:hypothetical protein
MKLCRAEDLENVTRECSVFHVVIYVGSVGRLLVVVVGHAIRSRVECRKMNAA